MLQSKAVEGVALLVRIPDAVWHNRWEPRPYTVWMKIAHDAHWQVRHERWMSALIEAKQTVLRTAEAAGGGAGSGALAVRAARTK